MRTVLFLLAGVSALSFAQQASAQDFTGPRVEVNAGYDSTNADDGVAATPNTLDGVRLGGAIGYDIALGNTFRVGLEADAGFLASGDNRYAAGTSSYRITTGRDLGVSLRAGAKIGDKTFLYAKGGYANSQYNVRAVIGGTTGNTVTNVRSNEDGWRIGAGIEHMITDKIYAKAEYRYTDYGNDVSRHQALVGIGYRF
ncbi:MAG: porin family protein [Sphingomonas sp.]|uniref:outer membrane protein n=1 Tax=Sphingomonas sp. TaxID=28214 RepID=UPI0025E42328|nr:porin family protein [Sphingomonas sp.]MBX3566046.1 porin family protein [Sphingomonas sp.]